MKKKLYTAIIILNYNNFEDTINCIESIEKFNSAPIKYIVVENGSKRANSLEKLEDYMLGKFSHKYLRIVVGEQKPKNLPKATLLVNNINEGYAMGNNRGLELIDSDNEVSHVMILNNDVLFIDDIIPTLLSEKNKLNDCAIISPALYKKDMSEYDYTCARMAPSTWALIKESLMLGLNYNTYRDVIKKKYWLFIKNPNLKNKSLLEIEMPSGSCMLLEKRVFKDLGWFDPKTFLYYEENILYSKVYARGWKNYLLPQLRCIHLGASSTKKVASSFIQQCGLESRTYYLKSYCHLTIVQKTVYAFAYALLSLKLFLVKLIKENNIKSDL